MATGTVPTAPEAPIKSPLTELSCPGGKHHREGGNAEASCGRSTQAVVEGEGIRACAARLISQSGGMPVGRSEPHAKPYRAWAGMNPPSTPTLESLPLPLPIAGIGSAEPS